MSDDLVLHVGAVLGDARGSVAMVEAAGDEWESAVKGENGKGEAQPSVPPNGASIGCAEGGWGRKSGVIPVWQSH